MKLRNKKTGEIVELGGLCCLNDRIYAQFNDERGTFKFEVHTLAELNEEWEDVPAEEVWYLGERIGNYSMPKKEAKEATEKILAWKRLKDKGFRFIGKTYETDKRFGSIFYNVDEDTYSEDIIDDLDLLFGGEE